MGNCFKGSKKNTTSTTGTQHAVNKPGSTQATASNAIPTQATESDVSGQSKPAPQYQRIEQPQVKSEPPHPTPVHPKQPHSTQHQPAVSHPNQAPSSRERERPLTNQGANNSAPVDAEPVHTAGQPTVIYRNSVPSIEGKTERSKRDPEASIPAPAYAKPAQTGYPAIAHAKPAPPSQEYKQPGIHFDASPSTPAHASQSGPQAAQPTRTYGNSVPWNQGKTEQSRIEPEASTLAPPHGKPAQNRDLTTTYSIPADSSQEYKHHGIQFDSSRSATPHGKPDKTVEPTAFQEKIVLTERPIRTILGKQFTDIKLHYKIGKELGRGRSSTVYHCTETFTGKNYACKSILKGNPPNFNEEDVRREVKILERLRRKPNIVEFKEAYEDSHSVHLVMELCTGGELLDKIIAKRNYSEREAASVFRSIVDIIYTCHKVGVMHRDIKPENFLLSTELENSVLKAVDFGSSVFIEEGIEYRDIVGTAYYVAPEVLRLCYSKEADIWSAGVILYILLSGVPPFRGETEANIYDAILSKELDLTSSPWSSISSSAKDLVRKILNKDAKRRISLLGILGHPWVQEGGEASDKPLDDVVILRIKQTQQQPGRYRFN